MMQKYEQIMQPAGPQCSCSNNGSDQLATANVNRCSQHQVGNISDTASASSDLSALVCVCLAVPKDTATRTRTKARAHADMLTSADVHSADEQASSPLMRGMVDCNSNTASLEQEQNKKATSDVQQKEISVASSDCVTEKTTETTVGSLNLNDSRSSSTYLAQNKSEIEKVTEKSSESHPQRSASSPTNDSSSSSTDLLYQALHNRAINDSSSSSSADAETETDELLSSQDDEAKALRNKIENSTQIIRKRKRKRKHQAHPTAQDQSVSSLNSNSSSLSAVTTQAPYLYDSSSSSTGSPKPKPE